MGFKKIHSVKEKDKKGKDTYKFSEPERGSHPHAGPNPVDSGSSNYIDEDTGRTISPEEPELVEIEVPRKHYPSIHIYFNELSCALAPSTDGQAGGKKGWRYRVICKPTHNDYTQNTQGHFNAASDRWDWREGIGRTKAIENAYDAYDINSRVRQAVSNGLTYHTEVSPNHFVRNCVHWCWPEWKWSQPSRENLRFELVKFQEGYDDNGNPYEPDTHPEMFFDSEKLTQIYEDIHGEEPYTRYKENGTWKKKTIKLCPEEQRVDFYEHRSSQKEDEQDDYGSWYHYQKANYYTNWDVRMEEWSLFDVNKWAGNDGYSSKEYWEIDERMDNDYNYWFTEPNWDNWPKTTASPDETEMEEKQRIWDDWSKFTKASKNEEARPGRVIRINISPPPGRYGIVIDGARSYGWYPLNLCRSRGDSLNDYHGGDNRSFFTEDGGIHWEKHCPIPGVSLENVVSYLDGLSDSARRSLFNNDLDWDFSDTETTFIPSPHFDDRPDPLSGEDSDSDSYIESRDLAWPALYKITEGVGDGHKYGSPMWQTPPLDLKLNDKMSGMKTMGDGEIYGDVPVQRTGPGRELPYFILNLTADSRPKEIHFMAAPRGIRYAVESLTQAGTSQWQYKWTFGRPDHQHPRVKGPYSILRMLYDRWDPDDYYQNFVYVAPTIPGALAWIIETVGFDGKRSSVTIWARRSFRAQKLLTNFGSQDPYQNASEAIDDFYSGWGGSLFNWWGWF
jgi:hypothetical protein